MSAEAHEHKHDENCDHDHDEGEDMPELENQGTFFDLTNIYFRRTQAQSWWKEVSQGSP